MPEQAEKRRRQLCNFCKRLSKPDNTLLGGLALASPAHRENGPTTIRSLVREQPEDSRRDFLGFTSTVHGDLRDDALDAPGVATSGVNFCLYKTRAHTIYADTFARHLSCEPGGE